MDRNYLDAEQKSMRMRHRFALMMAFIIVSGSIVAILGVTYLITKH